ncbi:MAG TPA: hypothetical protein VJQ25_04380 [Nitrospira sp.]|nr:hypothetical protein [Nitrospira sp.]
MSITLKYTQDRVTYYLPRANSRLTTSARFQYNDRVVIGGVEFLCVEFIHRLSEGKVAPTTYVTLAAAKMEDLTPPELVAIQMSGFERDA